MTWTITAVTGNGTELGHMHTVIDPRTVSKGVVLTAAHSGIVKALRIRHTSWDAGRHTVIPVPWLRVYRDGVYRWDLQVTAAPSNNPPTGVIDVGAR